MDQEVYGVVYLITNLINGRKYVGQTIQKPHTNRWYQHCNPKEGTRSYEMLICKAIRKYGKENFNFEIVYTCYNTEELNFKESELIKKAASLVPLGYNITEAVNGSYVHSNATREKISQTLREALKDGSSESRKHKRGLPSYSKYHNVTRKVHKYKNREAHHWGISLTINGKIISKSAWVEEKDAAVAADILRLNLLNETSFTLNFPDNLEKYRSGEITTPYTVQNKDPSLPAGISYVKQANRFKVNKIKPSRNFKTLQEAIDFQNSFNPA